MRIVKHVKAEFMMPLIKEVIENGGAARITVTGSSMYPFLRENIDSVELNKCTFDEIRRGDIVLIKRDNGQYILHRVIKKENTIFYMVGDAQQWIEGPLNEDQLIAVATAIWRKDKRISCSNLVLRLSTLMWLRLLPHRYFVIKVFKKIRNLTRGKRQGGALT